MLPISLLLFDFGIKYMYVDPWKYYARVALKCVIVATKTQFSIEASGIFAKFVAPISGHVGRASSIDRRKCKPSLVVLSPFSFSLSNQWFIQHTSTLFLDPVTG